MRRNPKLALVYGDIGNKLFDQIKEQFPARAVNAGVSEANMISVASGMASAGLIPVTYTISSFHYLKTLEQVKLDAAYGNNRIIMVGTGGGLSYSELGTTHHSLEDLAMLGSIPGINIFLPGDPNELDLVFEAAIEADSPSWIRIGKKESERVTADVFDGEPKSTLPLEPRLIGGSPDEDVMDVAILSTGLCIHDCLRAAKLLAEKRISCSVWSFPQVVPFPEMSKHTQIWGARKIVVVEEHVEHGGLLTRVLHSAAKLGLRINIRGINSGTTFVKGMGKAESARANLGFSPEAIADRCLS